MDYFCNTEKVWWVARRVNLESHVFTIIKYWLMSENWPSVHENNLQCINNIVKKII